MKGLDLFLLVTILAIGAVLLFGPREPVDRDVTFDPAAIGKDLDTWLAEREAAVPNLRDGVEKRIVWAGEPGVRTPLAIVNLHGFSATSEEIRPVPDRVAEALGANLYFTRLAGHGRDGAAMAEPAAGNWIEDVAEAMAIGRRIGERVLLIGTSTGGTLAALAATDPDLSEGLAGVVFISPNFGLQNPAAGMLALPWARHWVPLALGKERSFVPMNADHAAFWTWSYPSVAVVPLVALVRHVNRLDMGAARAPALFLYSEADEVVSPAETLGVSQSWGGPTRSELRVMGPGDDPGSHLIAGDILSPGQTAETVQIIVDWAAGL